jgi:caffeoylshikimate esterase
MSSLQLFAWRAVAAIVLFPAVTWTSVTVAICLAMATAALLCALPLWNAYEWWCWKGPRVASTEVEQAHNNTATAAGVKYTPGWLEVRQGVRWRTREYVSAQCASRHILFVLHGLHCYGGDRSHTEWHVQVAKDTGVIVIAVDLEGHGESDGIHGLLPVPDLLTNGVLGFVHDGLRRHGRVCSDVLLFGESLGGLLAVTIQRVIGSPIAGIALVCPGIDQGPGFAIPAIVIYVVSLLAHVADAVALGPLVDVMSRSASGTLCNPVEFASVEADPLHYHGRVRLKSTATVYALVDRVHASGWVSNAPVWLAVVENDTVASMTSAMEWARRSQSGGGQQTVYRNTCHALTWNSQPDVKERVRTSLVKWIIQRREVAVSMDDEDAVNASDKMQTDDYKSSGGN